MDPPEDNFSFDFFDEEPRPPSQRLRGRLPQRPGRSASPRPARRELAPLLRLLALVFFVIFLLLVFALLVDSCAGASRHTTYANYMNQVNTIAQRRGRGFTDPAATAVSALTSAGSHGSADGAEALGHRRRRAAERPGRTERLSTRPPAARKRGCDRVAAAARARPGRARGGSSRLTCSGRRSHRTAEALALSEQAYRLLASDVIWDDLFLKPSVTQLTHDGVGGVNVPESHFLGKSANLLVTPRAMALRLNG